ncbi:hypothetical protein CFC21_077393 [Triticum aestivum]|uniref:Reverse transcriptase zinc-binding domain-containing protein n=4 Tax=Triticinae TaxID=1648030 RepID=A0A453KNH4_AEGTS|nr:hypothetical protein CFC21_077393 [Triticum aestivum]
MFVGRLLAHESLANRMKIQRLGVELDTACPVCHRLNEDGGHIFLKCKKVKECRSRLALGGLREILVKHKSAHEMLGELWKADSASQLRALVLCGSGGMSGRKPTQGSQFLVLRDDFAAAGAGTSVHLRDLLHSEAVVCLAAIDGAIRLGANRIIFESLMLPIL